MLHIKCCWLRKIAHVLIARVKQSSANLALILFGDLFSSYHLKNNDENFEKGNLKDELRGSGFEDCVVGNIVDPVDDKKAGNRTYNQRSQETLREIEMFNDSTNWEYESFRERRKSARKAAAATTYQATDRSSLNKQYPIFKMPNVAHICLGRI